MRFYSRLLRLAWTAILLCPAGVFSGASSGELGLWDCVGYAVSEHPLVSAGRWRVIQARRTVDEDATFMLPRLSAGAHYRAVSYVAEIPLPAGAMELAGHHDIGVYVEARHLLYDWDRRKNKRLGDIRLEQALKSSLGTVREGLALEAGADYLRMLGARRQVRINERSVKVTDEHYQHLVALHEAGLTTYDEVLKGEVHLEQARMQLSRSRNQVKLARAELLERMGLPAENDLSFADTIEGLPGLEQVDRRVGQALARRPALGAYDCRIASLKAVAGSVKTANLPRVSLFASGTAARPGIDMFRKEFIEYVRAGVVMDLKLSDWGAKGHRLARIEAQSRELTAERTHLERRIELEVERESLREEEAEDRLALATKAMSAAREHFRLVGERFDQGQVTNTEYIDAEEYATTSELEVSRAGIDLALARWHLAYVCGLLAVEIDKRFELENVENIRTENR